MDQSERKREADAEHCHRCCGAVVSVGAYGDWHHCEECEVMAVAPRRRRVGGRGSVRESASARVGA